MQRTLMKDARRGLHSLVEAQDGLRSPVAGYTPAVEPEEFDVCPILLTQPAQDSWTPLELSEFFLRRVTRVPVKTVMLENAGHYPIEQPGLDQMVAAIHAFCTEIVAAGQRGPTPRSS